MYRLTVQGELRIFFLVGKLFGGKIDCIGE